MISANKLISDHSGTNARGRGLIRFILRVFPSVCLWGFCVAQAATLNEWNFYYDPAGSRLSEATNSAGSGGFTPGNEVGLQTDGVGSLICTNSDSGTSGMWTNGAILDAMLASPVVSGVQYMRYDFAYDLRDIDYLNDSGALAGFIFCDSTGNKVAGISLKYEVSANTTPVYQGVELVEMTDAVGSVAVVAKIDLLSQTLSIWYDLTGRVDGFSEGSPSTNIAVSVNSFDSLRFHATGDIRPAGSTDSIAVKLLRTADAWEDIVASEPTRQAVEYSNEWTFEHDADGLALTDAMNSGENLPLAKFAGSENFQSTVFTTNRSLFCIGEDAAGDGVWTNGAFLDAALPAATSGIHYLRYDVAYDLSSIDNDSGSIFGVYFTGGVGEKVGGFVLGYDANDLAGAIPPNMSFNAVPGADNLTNNGTLTAIAEVNLDVSPAMMKIWYSLDGSSPTNYGDVAFSTSITLTTISNLRFQATGEFRPDGSADYVAVDNIRQASAWNEIIKPAENVEASPLLTVGVKANGAMKQGETNLVKVVVTSNNGGPATHVTSVLTYSGPPSAFTVISNNAPVSLAGGDSITNSYLLIANAEGIYNWRVYAVSAETNGPPVDFTIVVGSEVSYLTNSINEVSGGVIPGKYEPGEIIDVTVFSTNSGAKPVSNVFNSLSPVNPSYFVVSNITASVYPELSVGMTTSTVYRVVIAPNATNGLHQFVVTNRAGLEAWTNQFWINIFKQGLPAISTNTLELQVGVNGSAQKQVMVMNNGNAPMNFTIQRNSGLSSVLTVDGAAQPSIKLNGGVAIPLNDPDPSNPYLNGADSGESDTIDIGFPFLFYGKTYQHLYLDSNGAVILSTSIKTNNNAVADPLVGDLPLGSRPLIAPFRHTKLFISDSNPVRYLRKSKPDRLVLLYNNVTRSAVSPGTNLQFQVELFADGQIKFSYYNINGSQLDEVAVGIQGDSKNYVNAAVIPASGSAVLFFPNDTRWVSYSPSGATVPAFGSIPVTFTANASEIDADASCEFTANFDWSTGGSASLSVNASVDAAERILVSPSDIMFFGNAGTISSTTMVLSNSGTAALNFAITDTNVSDAASYQGEVYNSTAWSDISSTGTRLTMLNPHENPYINATNEGFSALQPIGFEFPFYGNVYTQFSAGVNGGISLGHTNRISAGDYFNTGRTDVPQQFIAPYWGNLLLDGNAAIRYHGYSNELVITWQNLEQGGVAPGTDLTFQTVLYSNGEIEFRYRQINGSSWPFTKWGFRSGAAQTLSGSLILPGDETVITNEYGYPKTNYVNAISNRAASIIFSNYPVITYTPATGSIPAGGTAEVVLHGNASGLTPGGANLLANMAQLTIEYEAGTNDLKQIDVVFVVTNSIEIAMASALDEDGDGMTYDAELIAGTDPLDSSSVLIIKTDAGRDLSWPSAAGRTYTVWYTLNLQDDFKELEGAVRLTTNRFVDAVHTNVPVIYYKVTVE